MARKDLVTVRVNDKDREVAQAVAKRHDRTVSDLTRWLWRREARELGLLATATWKGDRREPAEA